MERVMVNKIFMPELVNELVNYTPPSVNNFKAWRLYRLCIKRGKTKLAESIYDKHLKLDTRTGSDITVALGMLITAQKENK